MKVYILKNKEQIVAEMNTLELEQYCQQNNMAAFLFETSYMTNDWNWFRQYPDILHICANSLLEAKSFVLDAYYHSSEYDGDCGVIFRKVSKLSA